MKSPLDTLARLADLPAGATECVEICGGDPVFPTRYRVVAPGAAAIAATGLAAAELWELKTGRRQRVRVNARAAAAGLRTIRQSGGAGPDGPGSRAEGLHDGDGEVRSGCCEGTQPHFG